MTFDSDNSNLSPTAFIDNVTYKDTQFCTIKTALRVINDRT